MNAVAYKESANSDGDVSTQYNYSPFGVTQVMGTDVSQPFRFTGREWDAETGLYYYRARYYSPEMGRFVSEDPIRFAGGDVNWYRYVGNNSVNNVDPLGLIWKTVGYEYPSYIKGHLNMLKNKFADTALDDPLCKDHGMENAKRYLKQVWVRDPNNPERDSEYLIGTERLILQNQTLFIRQAGESGVYQDDGDEKYYQWTPNVPDSTYNKYPNTEYIYPPSIQNSK
jgi:RHS repeat-associated protein